jgi:hypothetical protein
VRPAFRVIHDAHPLWISLNEDQASRALFDKMHWTEDVLALPLFGVPETTDKKEPVGLRVYQDYWTYEPGSRLGVLYVGAMQEALEGPRFTILRRFADRIGVVASLALQQDRLTNSDYQTATRASVDRIDHEVGCRSNRSYQPGQ